MGNNILQNSLPSNLKYSFNNYLEGLRGFAAFSVMLCHSFIIMGQGDNYPLNLFIGYFNAGKLCVWIFFMLSGYVIGLTYREDRFNTIDFYKKRLLRIYPIYLITFVFLFILGTELNFFKVVGNMLMLQNENSYLGFKIPVEKNLIPIWSINYEVLYYLIFPLIPIFKPKITYLFIGLLLVSCIGFYTDLIPIFLSDYATGYIFWLTGLIIVWKLEPQKKEKFSFLSYVFLIIAYERFSLGKALFVSLGMDNNKYQVGLHILFYLPLCVFIVSDLAQRKLPYKAYLKFICYVIPLPFIIILYLRGQNLMDDRWLASIISYTLAILLIYETNISTKFLLLFSKIGKISYALYLVHWPMGYLINKLITRYNIPFFEGHYYNTLLLWILLTFLISYLLEMKFQPYIKSRGLVLFLNRMPKKATSFK